MALPPHPEPPSDLAARPLPLVSEVRVWWRLHQCVYGPIYFGNSGRNRFDAPEGARDAYRVLYAAGDTHGAFIETLGRATGVNRVDMQILRETCLARIETQRPFTLVDLTGAGLARIGADERICAGDDYTLCGRWALALWHHPQQPDGLFYRARHDPARRSLALFDRQTTVDAVEGFAHGALADPHNVALLSGILDTYQFQLLP